jgi:anti-sigma B factor antagonist
MSRCHSVTSGEQGWKHVEDAPKQTDLPADLPVVALSGEIDLAVAPTMQERLDALFGEGKTTIVVDLLDATFLDSIALGVLVGALERCRKSGGELHLVVTEPRILRVLEITGLVTTFPIHSTWQGHATEGHADEVDSQ